MIIATNKINDTKGCNHSIRLITHSKNL